ncbi:MAG: MFS transporter [Myxococcota bacterium]
MSEPGSVRRLSVLGLLYVAQGIVYGFGGFILVPSLAAAGVSLQDQAGLLALAGLPWVLKLVWAPLLDRFGGAGSGRARWFAAGAMVVMSIALWGLASRPSLTAEPSTVAWLWLLVNAGLSLQDVATDALVIDRVPPGQRGVANGVLLGGHHLGVEGVGGLGLGLWVASGGLAAALWAQAAIMLVLAGAPLLLPRRANREPTGSSDTSPGDASPGDASPGDASPGEASPGEASSGSAEQPPQAEGLRRVLVELVRRRHSLAVAALAAVLMSADVLTATISGQFWVQRLHWTVEELSTQLAPLLLVVNLLAYAGATGLVDRLGHARAAARGCAGLGLLWVGFGLVPTLWPSVAFMVVFVVFQALATAVFYVGIHAALMGATSPAIRASHFAVLMALLNLPRVLVPSAAPGVLDALGYSGLFVAAGAFQLLMAGAIGRVWPRSGAR